MLSGKGLLSSLQRTFLQAFATLPDQGAFCLVGGTALAEFYLGHRYSFDLHLFTDQESLILPFSYAVQAMGASHALEISVVRRFASYVEFLVKDQSETLKVDLALGSPFRFAAPAGTVYGTQVVAFEDLRVDKLLAYYGRAEPRDAVDLHFILRRLSKHSLLAWAVEKDPGFDLYWFAVALNRAVEFPDEPERWPVKMVQPLDPPALKGQFREWALELMSQTTRPGDRS